MKTYRWIILCIVVNLLALLLVLASGCTFAARHQTRTTEHQNKNQAALTEESRALTTGIVDALSLAPTNPPTALALDLARHDQQVEGLPLDRLDVRALLEQQEQAWTDLQARYDRQGALLIERQALADRLAESEAKLLEMGKLYEAERNKSIWKRAWLWATGTIGIGGLIALCVFCPAIIPILGHLLGFVVNRIPKLASALGVVSRKAFDAVVKGVGEARWAMKAEKDTAGLAKLDHQLLKATGETRAVVEARREALNL